MIRPRLKTMLLGTTLLALTGSTLALSTPASAQQTQTQEQDADIVVVTGSRIEREGYVSASPVATVTGEDLAFEQPKDVEDILRQMPQFLPGNGGQVNNGSYGVSTIDLRGLTTPRTLPLIDGRRMVGYDPNGLFDVTALPLALLDRVEVVTGGASAVYGSDAIAGVVNFILKDDFRGAQFDASYGITDHGDGEREQYSATLGASLDEGRGNVAVNVSYLNTEPVYQVRGPALFTPGASSYSTPASFDAPDGRVQVSATGTLVAPYQTFDFNPQNLYQTPQTRWTATVLGRYDINDDVEAYTRFLFANSQTKYQLASSAVFGDSLFIPLSNPFLTSQASQYLAAHVPNAAPCPVAGAGQCVEVGVRWRAAAVGPRTSIFKYDTFQALGGLRGEIWGWRWDIAAAHGETGLKREQQNDINLGRIQEALYATNQTTCRSATIGCVPLNLFNPSIPTDPAALDFIRISPQLQSTTTQDYVTATISGDLGDVKLPTAQNPIGLSFGTEYRQEETDYRPDTISQSGDSPGFGQTLPINGRFDVYEVFGEALIPLIEDAPFAKSVNLELGYRHSDYSTSGATDSYKAGADWSPIDGLRFRGMFQRAVRAANLAELYSPRLPGTGDLLVDPCANGTPAAPLTGAIRAICLATGVPAAALNGGTLDQPTAGQVNNFSGGFEGLTPEEADTITVGFVWQPDFVPGLGVTVDYYDIQVNNAIALRPIFDVIDGCYTTARNPTLSATAADCRLITRNALNGSLEGDDIYGVDQINANIGEVHAEGVDYSIRYQFDLPIGELTLALDGTHVIDSSYIPVPGGARVECAGRYGKQCGLPSTVTATTGGPTPEDHWIQRTTWSIGAFDISYLWRHLSGSQVDATQAADTDPPSDSIEDFDYIDLAASWRITDDIRLNASVDNVFDKDAPVVVTETGSTPFNSGNTYPSTYDVLGRVFTVGLSVKF